MLEAFFYLAIFIVIGFFIWGIKTASSPLLLFTAVLMIVVGTTVLIQGLDRENTYTITTAGATTTVLTETTNYPATPPTSSDPAKIPWIVGNILFYGSFVIAILAFWNYTTKENAKNKLNKLKGIRF